MRVHPKYYYENQPGNHLANFSSECNHGDKEGYLLRKGNMMQYPGTYEMMPDRDRLNLVERSFVYDPSDKRTGGSEVEGELLGVGRLTNRSQAVIGTSAKTEASRRTKGVNEAVFRLKSMLRK